MPAQYCFLDRVNAHMIPNSPKLKKAMKAHRAFLAWEQQQTMDKWKIFLKAYGNMLYAKT